ncbi:MAG: hypothetical protein H6774_00310 [Pseudomonadales bacterium]|nr:hypothetical protein [Candidatus Woesebacteria bacterium]MCB9801517.1 hypothetical protein [Pseudomonadales bacterium]
MNTQRGSALVMLLVITSVCMIVIVTTLSMMLITTENSYRISRQREAQMVAESGIENALVTLLRNPEYTGEILTIDSGTATITVIEDGGVATITSVGVVDTLQSRIVVEADTSSGAVQVISWQEQ